MGSGNRSPVTETGAEKLVEMMTKIDLVDTWINMICLKIMSMATVKEFLSSTSSSKYVEMSD